MSELFDLVQRTKSILYGQGLGEKPVLVRGAVAADANVSFDEAFGTASFTVGTGEGSKIKPGRVLSARMGGGDEDACQAVCVYVLEVAEDTVTGVDGYLGAPLSTAGKLSNRVFEMSPLAAEHEVIRSISTIVRNFLWPQIYQVVDVTVNNPDLVNGQEEVPGNVEEIISAWQIIGPDRVEISHSRQGLQVPSSVGGHGRLVSFGWVNGSPGYYNYRAKYDVGDIDCDSFPLRASSIVRPIAVGQAGLEGDGTFLDQSIVRLVALGAAGFLLGGTISGATTEGTKKDNVDGVRQRVQVGNALFRDFLTLRANMSDELTKRLPARIHVNRD